MTLPTPEFSIIIPAFKEGARLIRLAEIFAGRADTEIVASLVRGDEETTTPGGTNVITIRGEKGRARQMNAGAVAASGRIFVFLHADAVIAPESLDNVESALARPGVCGGAYRFAVDEERLFFRALSFCVNVRSALLRLPYGDQAIFMLKETYEEIGGFDETMPIMEDVEMIEKLRNVGKITLLRDEAKTSARKWKQDGALYTSIRNITLLVMYKIGVSPASLERWYYK